MGFIVALNGSDIFPDGSAVVKHSDALYKEDRRGPDVPSRLVRIEVVLYKYMHTAVASLLADVYVEVKQVNVLRCERYTQYELSMHGALEYLARNDVAV